MNTVIGALIAAIITGLTATLALLTGADVGALSDVSPLQWIVLAIGVLLAFFKDLQAVSARRLINEVTNTGDGI